jgi:hypothetical protein
VKLGDAYSEWSPGSFLLFESTWSGLRKLFHTWESPSEGSHLEGFRIVRVWGFPHGRTRLRRALHATRHVLLHICRESRFLLLGQMNVLVGLELGGGRVGVTCGRDNGPFAFLFLGPLLDRAKSSAGLSRRVMGFNTEINHKWMRVMQRAKANWISIALAVPYFEPAAFWWDRKPRLPLDNELCWDLLLPELFSNK